MILGDGPLADGARAVFTDVPFVWLLEAEVPGDLPPHTTVVISHPHLVGTTARLEATYPRLHFAYVPENVRADHPEDWKNQARYVIGTRHPDTATLLAETFSPAIFMSPESAEMVKHALNGFLATSVLYAREIARLSTLHGADPDHVAQGMMSDPRIGPGAYLRPEGDLSPHLNRELANLRRLGFQ